MSRDSAVRVPAEAAEALSAPALDHLAPTGTATAVAGGVTKRARLRKRRDPMVAIAQFVVLTVTLGAWEIGSRRYQWDFWVSRPTLVWDQLLAWKRDGQL